MYSRTVKHVCFTCRLSFHSHPNRCPECSEPLVSVGLDFQAPPRSKKKEWLKLEKATRIVRPHSFNQTLRQGFIVFPKNKLRKKERKQRARQEAYEKRTSKSRSTCCYCGTFCKNGILDIHSLKCAKAANYVPIAP